MKTSNILESVKQPLVARGRAHGPSSSSQKSALLRGAQPEPLEHPFGSGFRQRARALVATAYIGCSPNGSWIFLLLALAGLAVTGCRSGESRAQVDTRDLVTAPSGESSEAGSPVLRVAIAAMISPETTRSLYEQLILLIAKRAGLKGELIQKRTYAEINELIEQRRVDLAFVCSGPYVEGQAKFGLEILVVPMAYGKLTYHSYILASAQGAVHSLDDLEGKRFAFTDPNSNTGCLVPRYMLAKQNKRPETFFGQTFYSWSHDSSIRAVAEGRADGAAVDSLIWEYMNATDPTHTQKTRIVAKSPPYGIPPIVVHPALDSKLKERLRQIMLEIHKDTEAAVMLKGLHIDRFSIGDNAAYDTIREMRRFMRQYER